MKTYFFLLSILCSYFSFAQKIEKKDVPIAVIESFESYFPKAKNPKWELDFENYQVDFVLNKVENTVLYNKEGKLLEQSTIIKASEVPKLIRDSLSTVLGKSFSSTSFDEIKKVVIAEKESFYIFVIGNGQEGTVYYKMSEKGILINQNTARD